MHIPFYFLIFHILLIITCVTVISAEMMNTAIEVVIDKVSPGYSALAKVGKDVAAGAVFVTAIAAVIIGITLFWNTEKFVLIFRFFTGDIWNLAMLAAFACLASVRSFASVKSKKCASQLLRRTGRGFSFHSPRRMCCRTKRWKLPLTPLKPSDETVMTASGVRKISPVGSRQQKPCGWIPETTRTKPRGERSTAV